MRTLIQNTVITLICVGMTVSTAAAETAPTAQGGGSLLLTLFIGFFALIVVFQLVPACLLFVGILKGLFARKPEAKQEISNR